MKIYFDKESLNVLLEGDDRLFPSGSLLAEELNGNVVVKYKNTNVNNLYISHTSIETQYGSPAGTTLQEVIDYLNVEFNKGLSGGDGSFGLLQDEVTINNTNIFQGDIIMVMPVSITINEIVFIKTVFDGGFTVGRMIINALGTLTNNLPFNWIKY